jgi:cytochrome P450
MHSTASPPKPIPAPGPRPDFPGAHLLAMRRNPLGFLTMLARDYGDVVRMRLGTQQVYLLNHPDHIRDVLVTHNRQFMKGVGLQRAKRLLGEGLLTSEGDFHLQQRRLAQPAFHHERIAAYGDVMSAYAVRTAERWRSGEVVDVHGEMLRLTLAIAGKTLFDSDVEEEATEIGEAIATCMALFRSFSTLPLAQLLERLPLPSALRFQAARARLDATIYRMIAARRDAPADRGDLLSLLMLARDDDSAGGRMTDRQLRDEVMTIFLAGHETTANALTWTWHLLTLFPSVERKLHAEVDAVLGDRPPGAADMARLPYATMVLAESMRLYPPAWVIGRRALTDYSAGGYDVPAGSIVLLSQWVTHRDPRWFPVPERFDPERWTPEARAARPRFAYYPFGGGARICIGEQFAWMEGVLALATLARRWRLGPAEGQRVEPAPSITLRPRFGLKMVAVRR